MTTARWHEHETAAYKLLDSTLAKKKQEHDLHVVQIVHLSLAQQHVNFLHIVVGTPFALWNKL